VPPLPNDEHRDVQLGLAASLRDIFPILGLGYVRAGVNISDRDAGWQQNFRGPDVAVFLQSNTHARNRGTRWVGGPDLAVEILSPDEDPYAKLDFYASIRTGSLVVVHREPWKLELFVLEDGELVLAGSVMPGDAAVLSVPLGVALQLVPGTPRPRIELRHPSSGQAWTI
jgi:Uma2 family endonuclease